MQSEYQNFLYGLKNAYSGNRILLAEDVDINAEIVVSLLEGTGAEVTVAKNGKIALDTFRADDNFDLILMDIHMPFMDGYTATKEIRSLPSLKAKAIPIVAMTANVFREDVERCLACGMNDHIPKPIDQRLMFRKLSVFLHSKPASEEAQAAAPADCGEPMYFPYIDVEDGLARLMNNRKVYVRLLNVFFEKDLFGTLKKSLAENDGRAAELAHSLKGTSANLALKRCYEVSVGLEQLIIAGKPHDDKLAELEVVMKKTADLVKDLIERLS